MTETRTHGVEPDRSDRKRSPLPEGRKDVLLFDEALPGFGLRVTSGGTRTFIFQYRAGAKVRRTVLGTFGAELTTAQARKKAESLRGQVRDSRDPVAERRAARIAAAKAQAAEKAAQAAASYTVDAMIAHWAADHLAERSESYANRVPAELRRALAEWKKAPADSFTQADAVRTLDAIKTERGPIAANRLRAVARACWGWAVKRGALASNPWEATPRPARETAREVSPLCAEIDTRVNAFLSRPLEGRWPYLWLDATDLKVRDGGRIVSRAVIFAVAVNEDGKREALGVATGPSEAETFWTDFLRSVADRGLRGVKLVVADDHKGLRAAVIAMLKTIFAQDTKAEAVTQWNTVADALREKQPKLSAMMDASREDVLAYMDFPKEHWPQIASTNPLERLNKGARHCLAQAPRRCRRHLSQRRGHHPPCRRTDARDQRRVGRGTPLHEPGSPRPRQPY
jgi:hypothetical protein